MKITDKDLQKLYKAHIVEKIPISRKNCPSQKKFINFFRTKLSEKQRIGLIDHITNCCYCAQEFEFTTQILRDEKKLIEEIGNIIQNKWIKKTAGKSDKGSLSYLRKRKILFFPALSWKLSLIIFGAVILISALIIFQNSERRDYRDKNTQSINLIEPIKGKYSKSLLVFKWNEYNGSDHYILEIFDETLYPVWESNKILKNNFVLPDEIAKKLIGNKTYFWMITAFLADGRKIESKLEEFTVTD